MVEHSAAQGAGVGFIDLVPQPAKPWRGACPHRVTGFGLEPATSQNGIPHSDIDKSADARAGYEKHGRGGIPLIFIGKDHMRGFNSQRVETRLDPSRRR